MKAAGALTVGSVIGMSVQTQQRELSQNARIQIVYSNDARGSRPKRLFLKICKLDLGNETLGPSEVHYYARDYLGVPGLPLLPCYHAVYAPELGVYALLLEDVGETHETGRQREPTLPYALALAEGFARMHAHRWGLAGLQNLGMELPDRRSIDRYVKVARDGLPNLFALFGEEVGEKWRTIIDDIFVRHPRAMLARTSNPNGFTVIHGDPNPTNILSPVGGDAPLYLIDRQPFDFSLTAWLGASDPAYLMVTWWEPDLRRIYEKPFLERYHNILVEKGVRGYGREQLWEDYRLSAIMSVYVAVEWCRSQKVCREWKAHWFGMLNRAMAAYEDLDCKALL